MPYNTFIHTTNMTISVTDLLDFLNKADQLSIQLDYTKNTEGYFIKLYYDWDRNNDFYHNTIFINNKGVSDWNTTYNIDETFDSMNDLLDMHIKRDEEKKVKEYKRRQLIDRLTDEEKELLGVK